MANSKIISELGSVKMVSLIILTFFVFEVSSELKQSPRVVKRDDAFVRDAPENFIENYELVTPNTQKIISADSLGMSPTFDDRKTTKSLEQNIEDYYSSVDIEFDQIGDDLLKGVEIIGENDKSKEINFKSGEKYVENDASKEFDGKNENSNDLDEVLRKNRLTSGGKTVIKRSVKAGDFFDDEEYDDYEDVSDDEVSESDQDYKKYYRDTFFDRIAQETRDKRRSRRESPNLNDSESQRSGRDITGDTVLHIRSGMSDVIKSETDLKDSLTDGLYNFHKEKPKSYIDDIMIHPSAFIRDVEPFGNELDKDDRGKSAGDHRDGTADEDGDPRAVANKKPGRILLFSNSTGSDAELDEYQADFFQWNSNYEEGNDNESEARANDTEELLASLEARKVVACKLPTDVTSIAWFKDGEPVPLADDGHYQMLDSRHLVIGSVGREHAGTWECRGTGAGDAPASRAVVLIVMEPPSAPYLEVFGRRLDPGNVFLPAPEGSELRLACRAERGRPSARLRWEPRGLLAGEQTNSGLDMSSSLASFVVRRSHHNTTIACIATHPSLSTPMVASTLLHVQYAPRFGISRVPGFGFPLQEGSALSLRCEVDSNPPAHPRWRKDERDPPVAQSADGYLNFSSVRREHSGWYKCSATHSLGNFSSIGYFLNVRYEVEPTQQTSYHQTVTGHRVEMALGGAVQLQCPPGSAGCWSPNAVTSTPAVPAGLLYLSRGEYRCQGRAAGEGRHLQALQQTFTTGGPTVYPQNATVAVLERDPVVLESEYCARPSPSRVVWLAAGLALPLAASHGRIVTDNYTNSTSEDCYIARLTIEESVAADAGEYSLLVRSAAGVAEAVFQVTVGRGSLRREVRVGVGAGQRRTPARLPVVSLTLFLAYLVY